MTRKTSRGFVIVAGGIAYVVLTMFVVYGEGIWQ